MSLFIRTFIKGRNDYIKIQKQFLWHSVMYHQFCDCDLGYTFKYL